MSTPNQGEDSLNLFNWAETTPLISIIQQSVQFILCRFFLRIIFTFHMSICQHVIRKLWAPRPRSQNKNQIIHNLVALGIQPSWPCFQGRLSSYKKIRSALAFLAAGLLCSESKIVWKPREGFIMKRNSGVKCPPSIRWRSSRIRSKKLVVNQIIPSLTSQTSVFLFLRKKKSTPNSSHPKKNKTVVFF